MVAVSFLKTKTIVGIQVSVFAKFCLVISIYNVFLPRRKKLNGRWSLPGTSLFLRQTRAADGARLCGLTFSVHAANV